MPANILLKNSQKSFLQKKPKTCKVFTMNNIQENTPCELCFYKPRKPRKKGSKKGEKHFVVCLLICIFAGRTKNENHKNMSKKQENSKRKNHMIKITCKALPILLLVLSMSPLMLNSRNAYRPSVTICDSDSVAKQNCVLPILSDSVENGL